MHPKPLLFLHYHRIQIRFVCHRIVQVYIKDFGDRATGTLAPHPRRRLPTLSRPPARSDLAGGGRSSPAVTGGHARALHCRCFGSWFGNGGVFCGNTVSCRETKRHQLRRGRNWDDYVLIILRR